jgi:endonuclease YncB( thermonuclease family)
MERAEVTHIVDGDTLDVLLNGTEERVRIFGVDTPERGERCFREASDRLSELADDTVLLVPDARNRDPSGRLLRYLYTPAGLSIDAMLIADGFAHAWTRDGALREPLMALEEHAMSAGAGCLW